jgi:hypothetical protein
LYSIFGLVIFVRSIDRTNVQTSFEFPNKFGKNILMEAISKRLYDYFFKHKGYKNDTVVSKELGYSHPEKISRLFREGTGAKPSVDILEDITNKFGEELNIEWVLTGKGLMIKTGYAVNYSLNDPGEREYKTAGKLPAAVLLLLKGEVTTMQASLDRLAKVVEEQSLTGSTKDRPAKEDLFLDKKNRSVKDSKNSVRKKGT